MFIQLYFFMYKLDYLIFVFGIMSRYHKLSGKKIELEYKNSLNLSAVLKHKFGEEYVNHPRLDNLAHLNSFNGVTEQIVTTF